MPQSAVTLPARPAHAAAGVGAIAQFELPEQAGSPNDVLLRAAALSGARPATHRALSTVDLERVVCQPQSVINYASRRGGGNGIRAPLAMRPIALSDVWQWGGLQVVRVRSPSPAPLKSNQSWRVENIQEQRGPVALNLRPSGEGSFCGVWHRAACCTGLYEIYEMHAGGMELQTGTSAKLTRLYRSLSCCKEL